MRLDVGATIGSDIDGVFNAVAIGISTAVLLRQARPGHSHAHGRELDVAQSTGKWIVAAQLDIDGGLVLDGRDALDVVLLDRA